MLLSASVVLQNLPFLPLCDKSSNKIFAHSLSSSQCRRFVLWSDGLCQRKVLEAGAKI
jgi:hypothetical protein